MPELPEVTTVSKDLKSKVKDLKILDVKVLEAKLIKNASAEEFKNFLKNETILDVYNLAKHIVFKLSNNKYLLSHLRMTGKYFTYYKYRPASKHDYVIFSLSDGSYLFYNDYRKFGAFFIKNEEELFTTNPLDKLAPTPDKVDIDKLYEKLRHKTIAIKTLIMDQSFVSGIGNIYANEALFASKIYPATKANSLSKKQFAQLINNANDIMNESVKNGGSSIDSYTSVNGVKGNFQKFLKAHGHENEACINCGSKILKVFINQRGTYYCPKCQKEKNEKN